MERGNPFEHSEEGAPASAPSGSRAPSAQPTSSRAVPQYMTVGTGSESRFADALRDRLERDSGYGSMASASQFGGGEMASWEEELLQDRPTPPPTFPGEPGMSENEKKVLASHVHQLYYNQNRVALAKGISQTIELLKQLQEMNAKWPAHYPTVQNDQNQRPSSRPGMPQSQSTRNIVDTRSHHPSPQFRPSALRRAETTMPEAVAESSSSVEKRPKEEPRLVTPQIAQEFSILKLDLKVGALSQAELVHSLEKKSIASLLDGKISASVRHLLSLRDRIEDTSSKVLVTGDLNAGKSTFCNALLRRKILPEDQQPCTALFCEVLDAKENGGVEEVHAVHKDTAYDRNDESTYDIYSLQELEKIVIDDDKYMQCKVYVKDVRSIDQSLLNNGVVDIALIDAPGLNADSVKTTAVFARQEEIDVVVFVVSAANHFTLSAKEFIWQAAHEKAYIFMVVNGFDNIRDKQRCQKMILEQLAKLSPQTFKEASELVHFVSSNAVPMNPTIMPPSGGDGGGSGPGPDGNDDSDESLPTGKHEGSEPSGKGKDKDKEKIEDFEDLEGALRRFVLEKRARSKLAPAKTYLMNCLGDMNVLASVNRDVAQSELERVSNELAHIEPEYQERTKQRTIVSEQLDKDTESTVKDVYDHTRSTLSTTINTVGQADLGIEYPGLFSAFQYAEDLRMAMLDEITGAVRSCEDYGRASTMKGVNMIKSLGLLHVGESYDNLNFRADMMFSRRKDALARTVDTEVEVWDFFDVQGIWARQEKVVGSGMALTLAGTLGTRAIGGMGWVDSAYGAARVLGSRNLQRLAVPAVLTAAVCAVAYVLSTIPQTLPPRLARKLSSQLATVDYTHTNASRISAEVRRVLKFPAHQLAVDLQKGVEELRQKKEDVTRVKQESEIARKYFGNLVRDTSEGRRRIEAVDLEGPIPGAAGADDNRELTTVDRDATPSSPDPSLPPARYSFVVKLAGTSEKRSSTSGGILGRVFGKKDKEHGSSDIASSPRTSTDSSAISTSPTSTDISVNTDLNRVESPQSRTSDDTMASPTTAEKKRRSSSTAKAKEIFTQAKNSLIHGDRDGPQTPIQKLSKTDAALSVPQGSNNNSAGESQPTPNSSFLVGVTEDKNKKCRRTMEDTHSYLYNFLGTPAPALPTEGALKASKSNEGQSSLNKIPSDPASHVVETDNGYFAIFDGHAGTFAAEWCGKKLHVILEDLMKKHPNTPVPELLDQTFTTVDNQLEKLPLKNSGCTAITAVLRWEDRVPTSQSATGSTAIAPLAAMAVSKAEQDTKEDGGQDEKQRSNSTAEAAAQAIQEAKKTATRQRVLYTANVGDARIVLCRNGKALRLSYDHKGMDENEGRRISKAGGLILNNRVNGVLAVTRALGDSYLKDLVTGHPYTTETVIQPDQDEFLILACDGLWDVCSDQESVELIRNVHNPQEASKMLVEHALSKFSTDNLSVMVVRFDPKKVRENTSIDIGVQNESSKGTVSEVEMIVSEARRHSGIPVEGAQLTDQDQEELKNMVIQEHDEEQEPGPELTPQGKADAEKALREKTQAKPDGNPS